MPDHQNIHDLLTAAEWTARYKDGSITPEENAALQQWLEADARHRDWFGLMQSPDYYQHLEKIHSEWQQHTAPALARFHTKRLATHRIHFLRTTWFRYAAILLLIAGVSAYLYTSSFRRNPDALAHHEAPKPQDIAPGGNKATLTLADGSTIILDSAANGNLAQQGNTAVIKIAGGQLSYNLSENLEGLKNGNYNPEQKPSRLVPSAGTNTITTPKGGQYQITLPDGTKAWLNAASSITFPTAFIKERKITITGEVYLEVTQDKTKPFQLSANGTEVNVLGTSFNINAYTDEPFTSTTLLEGSIQINNKTILKPGQQAHSTAQKTTRIETADTEKAIAWKNGVFAFKNADLPAVMRQLARWYNVEVIYQGKIPEGEFNGKIGRDLTLKEVLSGLSETSLRYRLEEGNKIIILP